AAARWGGRLVLTCGAKPTLTCTISVMIPSLAMRWFLLLIILGIVVAWFWPAALHWTRHVQPQIVMALALFLSAWTLQSRRLYRALVWPVPALWALAISYGLLPALAWWSG